MLHLDKTVEYISWCIEMHPHKIYANHIYEIYKLKFKYVKDFCLPRIMREQKNLDKKNEIEIDYDDYDDDLMYWY